MVDLGSYKDKFSDSGQRILEHALNESRRRDQNFVSVEHILQALTMEEPDMFNSTMRELSLDPVVVKKTIEATDIFEALSSENGLFVDVLRNMGATPEAIQENVRAQVQKREQEEEV